MPQSIRHGAVEINGNFIIVGEWNYPKYFSNVWALDTTDKNAKWIEKPSTSRIRENFSIAKIDGKVFVCGGKTQQHEALDSVEIFDGNVWKRGPYMPTYCIGGTAVVIPMQFARSLEAVRPTTIVRAPYPRYISP